MEHVKQLFGSFLRDESGQDLIEYALVAAMIGLGATATLHSFATTISSALTGIGARLTSST